MKKYIISFSYMIIILVVIFNISNNTEARSRSQSYNYSRRISGRVKNRNVTKRNKRRRKKLNTKKTETNKKSIMTMDLGLDASYDDNLYELDSSDKMELSSYIESGNFTNNKYENMKSSSDFITSPYLTIKTDTKSPLGIKFETNIKAKYNNYIKNRIKNYPEFSVDMVNSFSKKHKLSFEGEYISGFYKKNYLTTSNDLNGNGNISKSEREYDSAVFDEQKALVKYWVRLIKASEKKAVPGLNISFLGGIRKRQYNSPFGNRNKNIVMGGTEAKFNFKKIIKVDFGFTYEKSSSPNNQELKLIDETSDGVNFDINGDGVIKENAPFVTNVDRSSINHILDTNLTIVVSKKLSVSGSYSFKTKRFTTQSNLDVDHYNIIEKSHKFNAEVKAKLNNYSLGTKVIRKLDPEFTQTKIIVFLKYNLF